MNQQLKVFLKQIQSRADYFIGYPSACDYDLSALYPFLSYNLNNVGDPYIQSNDMQSKSFEVEVIEFFSKLFNAPSDNHWGYVTNGGSEGNLYGLYLAREIYPNGIVYYTEATHYSVQKNIHLLNMESIVIRSQANGEMDYEDFEATLQMHRHRPVIVLANIGTTMTEAKDNVSSIKACMNKYAIKSSYIHCDAALSGIYLSLLGLNDFDFSSGADSIAISGHKFLGSPIACGVVLVKKSYKDRIGKAIPYIGTLDSTITGSRSGINALIIWHQINKWGKQGLLKRAEDSLKNAAYLTKQLNQIGIPAWKNEHALTVVFPKPDLAICKKWQLATDGAIAHVICMPGITKKKLDAFLKDIKQSLIPIKKKIK